MSDEIRLRVSDVEQALNKLKEATQLLDTSSATQDIFTENQLDVTNQLSDLDINFSKLVVSYKTLLLNNYSATKQSVEAMSQTDDFIAASLKK